MTGRHPIVIGARSLLRLNVGLGLVAVFICLLALTAGPGCLEWASVLSDTLGVDSVIVFEVRLPRVLMGFILGAGLAVVGAVFQALMRNPLADPYILGVSGGAALGGALGLALVPLGITLLGPQLCAFIGALVSIAALFRLARNRTGDAALVLLLGGVVFNAFAAACILLLESLLRAEQAQAILQWLMGTLRLDGTPRGLLLGVGLAVACSVAYALSQANVLNLMALDEGQAQASGLDLQKAQRRLLLCVSVIVGAVVGVGGLIGFVGLVVPHIARRWLGPDHRLLLPASAWLGGGLLVLCDATTRALFDVLHTDLPVGVVTAFVGAPVFLFLLARPSGAR